MCVVRKVLDKVFTYQELLYLDDILPGSKREPTDNGALENTGGGLELQVSSEKNLSLIRFGEVLFISIRLM